MDLNLEYEIKNMLKKYKYSDLSKIKRVKELYVSIEDKKIIMPNFFSKDGHSYEGTCSELMFQLFKDLSLKHPELIKEKRLLRIEGGESIYFKNKHYFLGILTEGNVDKIHKDIKSYEKELKFINKLINVDLENKTIYKTETLALQDLINESLNKGNLYIIDPSFEFLSPFVEGNYTINKTWFPGDPMTCYCDTLIFNLNNNNNNNNNTLQNSVRYHIVGKVGNNILGFRYFLNELNPVKFQFAVYIENPKRDEAEEFKKSDSYKQFVNYVINLNDNYSVIQNSKKLVNNIIVK